MNKDEIFAVINKNPIFHLATVENGEPRVRALFLYRADENGIIFHTGTKKDLYRQLIANPAVELCFNDSQSNMQIRVRGSVEPVSDIDLKKEIVSNREFLQPWVESEGYDVLAVFRLRNAKATIWTMETNFDEKTFINL